MTNPNKAELRRLATHAKRGIKSVSPAQWMEFREMSGNPCVILLLLDECEENEGAMRVWRRRTAQAEAERDAALAELEAYKSQLRALIHISDATGWERHTCGEIEKARALLAKEANHA